MGIAAQDKSRTCQAQSRSTKGLPRGPRTSQERSGAALGAASRCQSLPVAARRWPGGAQSCQSCEEPPQPLIEYNKIAVVALRFAAL